MLEELRCRQELHVCLEAACTKRIEHGLLSLWARIRCIERDLALLALLGTFICLGKQILPGIIVVTGPARHAPASAQDARSHVQRHARCLLCKRTRSREQQRRQRHIWREERCARSSLRLQVQKGSSVVQPERRKLTCRPSTASQTALKESLTSKVNANRGTVA